MATYEILSKENSPYLSVRVEFGEQSFCQNIITSKTGKALDEFLQTYSDDYEKEFNDNL